MLLATSLPPLSPIATMILIGAVLFWVAGYVMMVRRGFKDQSYGLPISVLCVNIPWEFYYGFCADSSTLAKAVAIIYLVPDLLVLWTCLKYGPDDFDSSLMKRGYKAIAGAGMAVGMLAIWGMHVGFADEFGAITATFTTALSVVMLLAMILRRNNVRGQSFYIGLCLLLGNACGWNQTLQAQESLQPNVPVLWVHVSYSIILLTCIIYLAVYVHVCRRDGINPWTRW